MPGSSQGSRGADQRPIRSALDPISAPYFPSLNGSLSIAKEVLMGSFQTDYRKSESMRILSDRELPAGRKWWR